MRVVVLVSLVACSSSYECESPVELVSKSDLLGDWEHVGRIVDGPASLLGTETPARLVRWSFEEDFLFLREGDEPFLAFSILAHASECLGDAERPWFEHAFAHVNWTTEHVGLSLAPDGVSGWEPVRPRREPALPIFSRDEGRLQVVSTMTQYTTRPCETCGTEHVTIEHSFTRVTSP